MLRAPLSLEKMSCDAVRELGGWSAP